MSEKDNNRILELEAKIKSLLQENDFLLKNSEDIFLLSTISEKIGLLINPEEIFEEVVEKISVLKNIPYCAIGTLEGNNIKIDCEYVSFSEENQFKTLSLSSSFKEALLKETFIIEDFNASENTITTKITTDNFSPNSFLLLSFSNNLVQDKVLICIDKNMKDFLLSIKYLVLNIIKIVNSRFNNLKLMQEITNQNKNLEQRVKERTEKLKEEYESKIKYQQELKISEEKFHTIFDSINDGIFVHDIETGIVVDINRRAHEMLGYSYNELLNLKIADFSEGIPPYTQYEALKKIKAASAGEPQLFEWRTKRKDGSIFLSEVNMKLATIGNTKRILVSARDISEKQVYKQAIEDSESINKILFDHSNIQIWEEDFSQVKRYLDDLKKSGVQYFEAFFNEHPEKLKEIASLVRIVNVNKKTLDFYNVGSREELILDLPSWFIEGSWRFFRDEIVALANNKDSFEGETIVKSPSGEIKHLHLSLFVPPRNIKELSRVFVSFIDITDTKISEANLELKVKERTIELEDANRDLEELNEVFTNRELRIMELREEVDRLKKELKTIRS